MSNYYISKDKKDGEVVFLEYNIDKAYKVTPKARKKGAIEVNKIVFISPSFSEKIIKKKIEHKIAKFLLELNTIDEDDDGGTKVRNAMMEAELLKLNIIDKYAKYLGISYVNLTLEKLQIIIESYRSKLFSIRKSQEQFFIDMFNNQEERKGKRGR